MIDMSELSSMEVAGEICDPEEVARSEWLEKRYGKITSSNFGKLTGVGRNDKFTQTGMSYLCRVVAERLGSWHHSSSASMEWGNTHERQALEEYQARERVTADISPFQFFQLSSDIGGTPDGIVGVDGCLEVKCPYDPAVHVSTVMSGEVPRNYRDQVDGHLLVTGREWCDFISFDPRMSGTERLFTVRVDRNLERLKYLRARLDAAVSLVGEMMESVKAPLAKGKR